MHTELISATGQTLPVEHVGRIGTMVGGIVDKCEHWRRDRLADAIAKRRATLQYAFTGEGGTKKAGNRRRHSGFKNDRDSLRRNWLCAKQSCGPQHGIVSGFGEVKVIGPETHR